MKGAFSKFVPSPFPQASSFWLGLWIFDGVLMPEQTLGWTHRLEPTRGWTLEMGTGEWGTYSKSSEQKRWKGLQLWLLRQRCQKLPPKPEGRLAQRQRWSGDKVCRGRRLKVSWSAHMLPGRDWMMIAIDLINSINYEIIQWYTAFIMRKKVI